MTLFFTVKLFPLKLWGGVNSERFRDVRIDGQAREGECEVIFIFSSKAGCTFYGHLVVLFTDILNTIIKRVFVQTIQHSYDVQMSS